MTPTVFGLLYAASLFAVMIAFQEIGHRFGGRRYRRDPEGGREGITVVNSAVFGLLGLIVAFTFYGAASRFDDRRQLIIEEANNIDTAWLRIDLIRPDDQPAMRDLFRQYLDSRLKTYSVLPDLHAAFAEYNRSCGLQREIWGSAVTSLDTEGDPAARSLMLGSLNDMFDIASTRRETTRMHPPTVIFIMLFALALGCATLAGYGMAGGRARNWAHRIGFASVMALSVYVIFEIEYPRYGLIQVSNFDDVLIELRDSMD